MTSKLDKRRKKRKVKITKQKQKQSQKVNVNVSIDQSKRSTSSSKQKTASLPAFPRFYPPNPSPNITLNIPDYLSSRSSSLDSYVKQPKIAFESPISQPIKVADEFRNKNDTSIFSNVGFEEPSWKIPPNWLKAAEDMPPIPAEDMPPIPAEEEPPILAAAATAAETPISKKAQQEAKRFEDAKAWLRNVKQDSINIFGINGNTRKSYMRLIEKNKSNLDNDLLSVYKGIRPSVAMREETIPLTKSRRNVTIRKPPSSRRAVIEDPDSDWVTE